MSRLGFAVSPNEVNRFKQSVVQVNDKGLPHYSPDHFTQWAVDNVDHNVAHWMDWELFTVWVLFL